MSSGTQPAYQPVCISQLQGDAESAPGSLSLPVGDPSTASASSAHIWDLEGDTCHPRKSWLEVTPALNAATSWAAAARNGLVSVDRAFWDWARGDDYDVEN